MAVPSCGGEPRLAWQCDFKLHSPERWVPGFLTFLLVLVLSYLPLDAKRKILQTDKRNSLVKFLIFNDFFSFLLKLWGLFVLPLYFAFVSTYLHVCASFSLFSKVVEEHLRLRTKQETNGKRREGTIDPAEEGQMAENLCRPERILVSAYIHKQN